MDAHDQEHEEALAYAQEQEETPETKKARKASMLEALKRLRAIEKAHEEGQPVYAEMAARIEARQHEAADALVREALEGM